MRGEAWKSVGKRGEAWLALLGAVGNCLGKSNQERDGTLFCLAGTLGSRLPCTRRWVPASDLSINNDAPAGAELVIASHQVQPISSPFLSFGAGRAGRGGPWTLGVLCSVRTYKGT